jgi:hypothetical protein
MRRGLSSRHGVAGLTAVVAAALVLFAVGGASATPTTGAVNTTDDPNWTGPAGSPDSGTLLLPSGDTATQACLNGQPSHTDPAVNCNIYANKTDVFISGTPNPAALGAGTYFFAVLAPGGQPDPNDGGTKNLSDTSCSPYTCPKTNADGSVIPSGDLVTNREFSSDGTGNITPLGGSSHAYDSANQVIQVAPFDDTTNPGGVYILATCKISDTQAFVASVPTADPSNCKYDAFKVKVSAPPGGGKPPAADLSVSKDANPTLDHEFGWSITKSASSCPTTNPCNASSATVTYTVTVSHDAGHDTNWTVKGTITILNFNDFAVSGVNIDDVINKTAEPAGNDPTNIDYDQDTHASCSVDDGAGVTVPAYDTVNALPGVFQSDYTCTWTSPGPSSGTEYNTVGIDWPDTPGSDDTAELPAGNADFTLPFTFGTATPIDNCANATDTFNGAVTPDQLGYVCTNNNPAASMLNNPNGPPPPPLANFHETYTPGACPATLTCGTGAFKFTYTRTISPDPTSPTGCSQFSNTASFADNSGPDVDHGQHVGTAGATVDICGPRFTPGYWKNHLGSSSNPNRCAGVSLPSGTGCSSSGPWAYAWANSTQWKCLGGTDKCSGVVPPGSPYTGYKVDTILKAAQVFSAMSCSFSGSGANQNQQAIGCLAGHLLSAKYNRNINDSNSCIDGTISSADGFLAGILYKGPSGTYTGITLAQRATAINLKTALDNYDNGAGCH